LTAPELTSQTLEEHVDTLVPVLVSSGSKHVHGVLHIKVVVTVKVTLDKLVDLGLGQGVEVLKLVHGLEFDHVETVGKNTVGLSLEQVFGFECGDVGDGGKDVGAVGRGSFDAVSVARYEGCVSLGRSRQSRRARLATHRW
jgi:hypothetical protein